jgi:hypothetical protein
MRCLGLSTAIAPAQLTLGRRNIDPLGVRRRPRSLTSGGANPMRASATGLGAGAWTLAPGRHRETVHNTFWDGNFEP